MKLDKAKLLIEDLLKQSGLLDYKFQWSHSVRWFGACTPSRKLIKLSRVLTRLNSKKVVKNTVLHEIAHALNPDEGHGEAWKATAKMLGCNAMRCYNNDTVIIPKKSMAGVCTKCGLTILKYRRNKALGCLACWKATGLFFRFNWTKLEN
jgi:predicted SprT family Zn-dependent metalloprotease